MTAPGDDDPSEPGRAKEGTTPNPPAPAPTDGAAPHPLQLALTSADDEIPIREIIQPVDRWAHRRAEPRLLALVWTTYLFGATLITILSTGGGWVVSTDTYRPAARMLMVLGAVGMAILWPLVRLSQSVPHRRPVASALQDMLVMAVPLQAIVWPHWWLARWPMEVVAALAALLAAWALVLAALVAWAQVALAGPARRGPGRAGWMAIFVAVGLAGLIPAWIDSIVSDAHGGARPAWMLSVVTGVLEVARDRSWTGHAAAVSRPHWIAIGLTALCGSLLWVVAGTRARSLARTRGLN